jgi:hypothetical protein
MPGCRRVVARGKWSSAARIRAVADARTQETADQRAPTMAELVEALCRSLRQAQGSLISVSRNLGTGRRWSPVTGASSLWARAAVIAASRRPISLCAARAGRPPGEFGTRESHAPGQRLPPSLRSVATDGRTPDCGADRTAGCRALKSSLDVAVPAPAQPPAGAGPRQPQPVPESSPSQRRQTHAGADPRKPQLPRRLRPEQHPGALDHEPVGNRAQRGRQHCGARQRPTRASFPTRPHRAPPRWTDIRVVAE